MGKSVIRESRALSARSLVWQSPLALLAAISAAMPASAVPGGQIGTLEQGRYTCELPGDASGATGEHVPEADFRIVSASSYRANGRIGSYLLTGDRVVMTSGPHQGVRFHRVSTGFLRVIGKDGKDGPLRCVLTTRNNS